MAHSSRVNCSGEPTFDDKTFPGFILIECVECGMSDFVVKM